MFISMYYLTGFNVLRIKYLAVHKKQHSHPLALCCPVNKKRAFVLWDQDVQKRVY